MVLRTKIRGFVQITKYFKNILIKRYVERFFFINFVAKSKLSTNNTITV